MKKCLILVFCVWAMSVVGLVGGPTRLHARTDVLPLPSDDHPNAPTSTMPATANESSAAQEDCSPTDVPGKHGTLNTYRVPFDGDGNGNGISQSIWVDFTMYDDGRITAPLKYDNASKERFCGGVHIRLGDNANRSIAEFYSDPNHCIDGRPNLGGPTHEETVEWNLQTTPDVACKYRHLYIVPNRDHPATSSTSSPNEVPTMRLPRLLAFLSDASH